MRSKDGGSFPAATPVDVPTGWDPRTKQQSTGLLFATYRWPCCSIPVRVIAAAMGALWGFRGRAELTAAGADALAEAPADILRYVQEQNR